MTDDRDELERRLEQLASTRDLLASLEQLNTPGELERQLDEIAAVCPLCLNPERARCGCAG